MRRKLKVSELKVSRFRLKEAISLGYWSFVGGVMLSYSPDLNMEILVAMLNIDRREEVRNLLILT